MKAALSMGAALVASQFLLRQASWAIVPRSAPMGECPPKPEIDSDAGKEEFQISKNGTRGIRYFDEYRLCSTGGVTKRVFYRLNGPIVLVLHEAPGLTISCVRFANRLYEAGYTPVLPLFFGEPCERYGVSKPFFDSGFHLFSGDETHPIKSWLDELIVNFPERFPGNYTDHGIGVVGMCLTGTLPLALLEHPLVVAPVVSQPAVPMAIFPWLKSDLGLSPGDLANARRRLCTENLQILGFRFENDWICPTERFQRLETELKGHFLGTELCSPQMQFEIDSSAHAVLTEWYRDCPDEHPTKRPSNNSSPF